MLIARMYDLPTLNGYSGWVPPDWNLDRFGNNYLFNIKQWVFANHVQHGLCGLDLRNGSWTSVDFAPQLYLPGSMIDFRIRGNSDLYEAGGWGTQEDGGSWTLNDRSTLLLQLPASPGSDLLLSFKAHSFLAPVRPHFRETLQVNGIAVADWSITNSQIDERVRLPRAILGSNLVKIEFIDPDPQSPAGLGLSTDGRRLGLALERLKIVPFNPEPNYVLGSAIDFHWGGDAYLYEKNGWGAPEEGGTWTLNERSNLMLNVSATPKRDLLLILKAHAFVAPGRPRFIETLRVNGNNLVNLAVDTPQIEERVRLPRAVLQSPFIEIEFIDRAPQSPAELGLWPDTRKLGLAVETLRLEPAPND
jgi:hypothetical protein